ncbi:MAG: hypothetical protein ACP5OA_06840 [Candidatus Woesearchaeota archaeon]
MFPIKDESKKEFCKDVLDIDYIEYVSGWRIIKRTIDSEQHYIDLEMLYRFNDDSRKMSKEPYVRISVDENGSRYARLSDEGTDYAFNNDFSFMPEWKERDKRNVPLRKALSKFVDYSLEDRICEKCGNILGLNCTKEEFFGMIKKQMHKKKSDLASDKNKKYSLTDTFLKSKDTMGGCFDINECDSYRNSNPRAEVLLKLKDIRGGYMN